MADEGEAPSAVERVTGEKSVALIAGRRTVTILAYYLVAIVLAETIITFYPLPTGALLGIVLHMAVISVLLVHASIVHQSDERLSRFMVAMILVPMVRVFSLSLPLTGLQIIDALVLISLPLMAAPLSVMYVLKLHPRAVGLALGTPRVLLIQSSLAATGVPLGVIEFLILRPASSWIPSLAIASLITGGIVVIVASGLAEELIFRGVLLREAEGVVGVAPALVYVTLLFTAMHIGFASVADLVFVFLVGLYFGAVVQRTRNLVGVTLAHGLANVVLYLVMPFYL